MSKTGANIFSGKIDLETNEVHKGETDVLFAGFISAILSVSEELQSSEIRELGYQDNKIIFTMSENLIFLGFVDTRVPNEDIEGLLNDISAKWMTAFEDEEYPYISDEMRNQILHIIQGSIRDVFWWAAPEYNLSNNVKYISTILTKPSRTYYVQYLPNAYLLTSLLVLLGVLGISYLVGVAFIGFASGPPGSGGFYQVRGATAFTISLLTLGTGFTLKIFYRNQFNFRAYAMKSMIYTVLLMFLIFFTTSFWLDGIYENASEAVEVNLLLSYAVQMFVFFAPFNTAFFGFIVLNGYGTSNSQNIPVKQYIGAYLLAILFMLSITQFVSTALLGVSVT